MRLPDPVADSFLKNRLLFPRHQTVIDEQRCARYLADGLSSNTLRGPTAKTPLYYFTKWRNFLPATIDWLLRSRTSRSPVPVRAWAWP